MACLAAASSHALNLQQALAEESNYDNQFVEENDYADDFFEDIEDDLNAGHLVPLDAIDKEVLIVDLPNKSELYDNDDEAEYEEGFEFEDAHSDFDEKTEELVAAITEGFDHLAADNAYVEQEAIAETQHEQDEDIKAIIDEANDEAEHVIAEAVHGNGELELEDLSDVYDKRANEISAANKVHDE